MVNQIKTNYKNIKENSKYLFNDKTKKEYNRVWKQYEGIELLFSQELNEQYDSLLRKVPDYIFLLKKEIFEKYFDEVCSAFDLFFNNIINIIVLYVGIKKDIRYTKNMKIQKIKEKDIGLYKILSSLKENIIFEKGIVKFNNNITKENINKETNQIIDNFIKEIKDWLKKDENLIALKKKKNKKYNLLNKYFFNIIDITFLLEYLNKLLEKTNFNDTKKEKKYFMKENEYYTIIQVLIVFFTKWYRKYISRFYIQAINNITYKISEDLRYFKWSPLKGNLKTWLAMWVKKYMRDFIKNEVRVLETQEKMSWSYEDNNEEKNNNISNANNYDNIEWISESMVKHCESLSSNILNNKKKKMEYLKILEIGKDIIENKENENIFNTLKQNNEELYNKSIKIFHILKKNKVLLKTSYKKIIQILWKITQDYFNSDEYENNKNNILEYFDIIYKKIYNNKNINEKIFVFLLYSLVDNLLSEQQIDMNYMKIIYKILNLNIKE